MNSTSGSIIPTLFCGGNAKEMAEYYTSIFKDSKIENTAYYPPNNVAAHHGYKGGEVLAITFTLLNRALKMTAMNGPPDMFHFTEAISFTVCTKDQEETDYYWDRLTADADQTKQFCCWCQDKFKLWWQVVPKEFIALMEGEDKKKASKAMEVSSTWKKADLPALRNALAEMEK